ncbi:hypothetical protein GCM10023142_36670 [Anaerocolumna aminovalerica]|jgi:hypothetical protein|uniref:Uncharacterized protein n=1 Tax=Anaerocolumna aminovalerica TaxID=1527 RepID=A0A1I5H752_9FIRM|nr:hypothetical protein [Anaerocolumna aminovalerica]MBU5332722.1 hypothetical protein [Anaerocolumna aminovalerica]MDU6265522.1 hypothetical protein [Anaerocolumna aminovalerica]SFO44023.1 hypothetical protein SAMN04489757_12640 [Anaerocolumna aminovalerica]
MGKVSATDLERQIFEKEEIKVVIRCSKETLFDEYNYDRKAAVNTSITDWYNTRLKPIIGNYDADIIDGYGTNPHGRTGIEKVRNSYADK